MTSKRTLLLQGVLVVVCVALLAQWALNFPFPGPVVRPLLGPQDRWPEEQIREWAKTSEFRDDFWAYFTRDPDRTIPPGEIVVSPADGLLRFIDKKDDMQYVVIALSFWDVHVIRVPCDGVITKIEQSGDTFMDAEGQDLVYLKNKVSPVQKVVTMTTKWGEFKVRLLTSISARRLEVWVKEGPVKKGEKLGRILAGSTVVIDMPGSFKVGPKIGDRVVGGETIIGDG